jgi:phosphoserine phosphatase
VRPRLGAVAEPIVVDPDARLRGHAARLGWRTLTLAR